MYGTELKRTRIEYGITQQQLAKETGLSQGAISLWEKDKSPPNLIDCVKIADFYGISVDELIGRDYQIKNK